MNIARQSWPRMLAISALTLMLAACASPGAVPPGAVLDAIQNEMGVALKPAVRSESETKAVEIALLPDLPTAPPKPVDARFDLMVQNAPASQVFMGIVSGTPYSMLLSPDVSGLLTLTLKDVTVKEALDTIRDLNGYEYRVEGNRIFIQGNAMQTRVFQVNYLAGRRSGRTDTRVSSTSITAAGGASATSVPAPTTGAASTSASSGSSNGASVATTSDSNFWTDVRQALTTLVTVAPGGGSVVLNESSGVIVIRATPPELRNVESYLKATQLVIERQVMLEAKILEVSLSDESQSGVNWASFGGGNNNRTLAGSLAASTTLRGTGTLTAPNTTVTPGQLVGSVATGLARGFYGLAFQSANFAALLSFLESQGSVSVLSSPRVATLNNQKAVLKVGSDEFFVTNVSTTTTTGTGATTTSPTVTLQPFFSGIALDVTPQIDSNDQIILHVHPSISLVSEKTKTIDLGAGGSLILPLAASTINESDSIVRVKDGSIVAIGGLMRQRQSGDRAGLPGTADVAGGSLFGQKSRSFSKSELVILIKPTVIKEDADWQESMKEAQTRLQEYAPSAPVRIIRP